MTLDSIQLQQLMYLEGYEELRHVPNQGLCGILRMFATYGLCYGMDETSRQGRFCYERREDASKALAEWDGTGTPSGPWIKWKGRDNNGGYHDDLNPNWSTAPEVKWRNGIDLDNPHDLDWLSDQSR